MNIARERRTIRTLQSKPTRGHGELIKDDDDGSFDRVSPPVIMSIPHPMLASGDGLLP